MISTSWCRLELAYNVISCACLASRSHEGKFWWELALLLSLEPSGHGIQSALLLGFASFVFLSAWPGKLHHQSARVQSLGRWRTLPSPRDRLSCPRSTKWYACGFCFCFSFHCVLDCICIVLPTCFREFWSDSTPGMYVVAHVLWCCLRLAGLVENC